MSGTRYPTSGDTLTEQINLTGNDTDARIVSLDGRYPEVGGGEYLRAKLAAISLG